MNNQQLISVIVLSYNSSDTIIETLDSIKNQTYKNIEIIVTDDCSKDNTIDVVNKWKESFDGKMLVLTVENNTGVSANCNRGLQASKGEYIKVIAGDDTLENDAIEEFVKHIVDEKVIYQSKVCLFGEGKDDEIINTYVRESYEFLTWDYKKQKRELIDRNYILAPAIGLLPKKVLESLGGFDERFDAFEDYPLYMKLVMNGFSFRLLDKELVNYRITAKSATGTYSKRYINCLVKHFFKEQGKFLIKEGRVFTWFKHFVWCILVKIGFIK